MFQRRQRRKRGESMLAKIAALVGFRGKHNWMPEKTTQKEYMEHVEFARQFLIDRKGNPEVEFYFGQYLDHCPSCGADIGLTRRIGGKPGKRYPLYIAKRRCMKCKREFKRMEGVWEWNDSFA